MLLRRLTQHVNEQNWFAVTLDFIIVVVGVFVGLQVSNWNEENSFDKKETALLYELKKEMDNSIVTEKRKIDNYAQVAAAGQRSLNFLASNESCKTECWGILVDFMHASQWQSVDVKRSTYENMRRIGLPRNNAIIDAVEAYLSQIDAGVNANGILPYYRELIRQLIPSEVQAFYWENCYSLSKGVESYKKYKIIANSKN